MWEGGLIYHSEILHFQKFSASAGDLCLRRYNFEPYGQCTKYRETTVSTLAPDQEQCFSVCFAEKCFFISRVFHFPLKYLI